MPGGDFFTPPRRRRRISRPETRVASALSRTAVRQIAAAVGVGTAAAAIKTGKKRTNLRKRNVMFGPHNRRTKRGSLRSELRSVKKIVSNTTANHTHRRRLVDVKIVDENEAIYGFQPVSNKTILEDAVSLFRYYDPANPGTLTTANATTGTYHRDILVNSQIGTIELRNNSTSTAHLTLYCLRPKASTNTSPTAAMTNGFTDQYTGTGAYLPDDNSQLQFPTDSDQFNKLWAIEKSKTVTLQPGRMTKMSCIVKKFNFDPSWFDTQTETYQPRAKARVFFYRIHGSLCHQNATTPSVVGTIKTGLDIQVKSKFKFTYDAGVNLNDFSHKDEVGTITDGRQNNKPEATNQAAVFS